MRTLIALDLSFTSTGIAVFYDGVFQSELSGTKGTKPADGTDVERADVILNEILRIADVITRSREKPSVYIEDYAFARSNMREKLGELGGIVKHGLWQAGYQPTTVPIATYRKVLTNKGNADKTLVALTLLQKYGLMLTQNDLADAAALGITADILLRLKEDKAVLLGLPAETREALKGYLKNK